LSMIHPADIGESVAELLTNKSYVGETCFLTGNVVSMGDVKDELSHTLGKEITYVQVSPEDARNAMQTKGMPDWLIAHMGGMMGLVARGGMAGVTDWVKKLTGHEPRTIHDWISNAKEAFS
jgi:NAD(P)H dehydrogenase (quinone)